MTSILRSCLCLAAFAACSADENPPTVTRADVDRAFEEASAAAQLPVTAPSDLPSGAVTYDGIVGASLSGDSLGSMVGDMTMRVDFADSRIAGNVRNINLINQDGSPDQRLDGSLDIAGFESNGALVAGAGGDVSAIGTNGDTLDADMFLDLDGTVRTDRRPGDSVYGNVTGEARGDFNLDIDGVFHGTQR